MPKQSTRHTYQRNANVAKKTRIILIFVAILAVLLLIRSWEDISLWLKAMTM